MSTPFCVGHQVDDRDRRLGVDLGRIGVGQAEDIARELDRRHVQAIANPEVRQL